MDDKEKNLINEELNDESLSKISGGGSAMQQVAITKFLNDISAGVYGEVLQDYLKQKGVTINPKGKAFVALLQQNAEAWSAYKEIYGIS